MKKKNIGILVLLLSSVTPVSGQIKQVTGGSYQFPDGTPCSRCTLTLQLVTDAVVVSTGQIIRRSNTLTYVLDANGNVPANSNLWGNDQLQPNGTTYVATLALPGGGQIWGPEYLSIRGASPINLAQLIPVANPAVYFSNPAVTNLSNVFTQPQTFNSQIVSTVATGTAPFSIASTTVVPNLNAQLLGGLTAPASAILGLTDSQSPTNKTIDISLNTLKTATNTAGHVPRNNGTQYVDGQLAASDLSTPLQGTDANLLTSGTVSASTGVPLCTDANHGATTSGCAASGVSEMIFSWGAVASSGGTASACNVSGGVFSCPQILLPNAHTITRFTYFLQTAPVGCSTQGVVGVWDFNNGSTLTTITVNQGASQFVDSGVISVATTAGHKIGIGWTTLPGGCSTFPSILSLTAILT